MARRTAAQTVFWELTRIVLVFGVLGAAVFLVLAEPPVWLTTYLRWLILAVLAVAFVELLSERIASKIAQRLDR